MNNKAITIRNLRKSFVKNREIVKGINLTVKRGAVYALLGSNGVGKTTMIRMITGQLAPTSGTVSVLGLNPFKDGDDVEIKRKVAYVAEGQRLYEWMTVNDLIKYVKAFYPNWNNDLCEHLLKMFALPAEDKIKDFSCGMYTKAALLAALCRDPELLILDDPTIGLDTNARHEFMSGVIAAINEFDRSVLFSTHIIPEIEGIADYVGIMSDGQLIYEGAVDDLKAEFREIRVPLSDTEVLPKLPGVVNSKKGVTENIVTIRAEENVIKTSLASAGIKKFTISPMMLENIFLTMTANVIV